MLYEIKHRCSDSSSEVYCHYPSNFGSLIHLVLILTSKLRLLSVTKRRGRGRDRPPGYHLSDVS